MVTSAKGPIALKNLLISCRLHFTQKVISYFGADMHLGEKETNGRNSNMQLCAVRNAFFGFERLSYYYFNCPWKTN